VNQYVPDKEEKKTKKQKRSKDEDASQTTFKKEKLSLPLSISSHSSRAPPHLFS